MIIGLLGLLFSPLLETRSVGIGGALVVCVSVLAALTLLPAALYRLGPRIDWLPVLRRRPGAPRAAGILARPRYQVAEPSLADAAACRQLRARHGSPGAARQHAGLQ